MMSFGPISFKLFSKITPQATSSAFRAGLGAGLIRLSG
jgi:hypothetical protein